MLSPALFGSIGYAEVLIALLVLFVVFGASLPRVARSLGKTLSQFRKGLRDTEDEPEEKEEEEADRPAG